MLVLLTVVVAPSVNTVVLETLGRELFSGFWRGLGAEAGIISTHLPASVTITPFFIFRQYGSPVASS